MKNFNKINVLKGHALSRRMGELRKIGTKMTEVALSRRLNKSRDTIAKWKKGGSWCSSIEETELEKVLSLPPGFFAAIAAGTPYDEALAAQPPASRNEQTIELMRKILFSTSPDMAEIQDHFHRQVEMIARRIVPAVLREEILPILELQRAGGSTKDQPPKEKGSS